MYKLEIKLPGNSAPKHIQYFNTVGEVNNYIKKCYPYNVLERTVHDKAKCDSIPIICDGMVVCIVNVEKINLGKPKDKKAWNGTSNIAEVFSVPFVYIVEEEFRKWIDTLDKENKNTYRIALLNDPESMYEFDESAAYGGIREKIVDINGTKFVFGCNFGY